MFKNAEEKQEVLNNKLRRAVANLDQQAARRLIAKGADVNLYPNGILHDAVSAGRCSVDFFQFLLDQGARTDAVDDYNYNRTPLLRAASTRQWDIVDTLIESDADLTVSDSYECTLMAYMIKNSAPAYLLEKVQKNFYSGKSIISDEGCFLYPLFEKSDKAIETLRWVLGLTSFNVNGGRLPGLLRAIHKDHIFLEILLADTRINLQVVDYQGMNALHYAIDAVKKDVFQELLERGVNLRHSDNKGRTPLSFAVEKSSLVFTSLILQHLDATKAEDKMVLDAALFMAVKVGNLRIIEMLVENGADINCRSVGNETPVMWAVKQNKIELMQCLIKLNADLSLVDDAKMSVRDYAGMQNKGALLAVIDRTLAEHRHTPVVEDGKFSKLGDAVIEVRDATLSTVFNFNTNQVIYRDGTSMTAQNFDAVQRQEAIVEAYEKLLEMGGHATKPVTTVSQRKKTIGSLD